METKFFLGSNSSSGFYSLYDDLVRPSDGDFLWVIKGGPGCGKSSFMKQVGRAAAEAGLDVDYIPCSGDPDSLDGVYIPALRVAYADGTAPHVMDAVHPGTESLYLDLGAFYDFGALESRRADVADLGRRYKALYARAYDFTAAAAAVVPYRQPGLIGETERQAVLRRAEGAAQRELGKRRGTAAAGIQRRRFLSAHTCQGPVFLEDTLHTLCDRVYALDDELGLADLYINHMAAAAAARNLYTILCLDPLCPTRAEALLIPSHGLGFLSTSSRRRYEGELYRHVRLDAQVEPGRVRQLRPQLRRAGKLYSELMAEAYDNLAAAKELHDELERVYNPCVDFDGMYALAQKHIGRLLG